MADRRIADIMTRNAQIIAPDDTVCEAAQIMDDRDVGALPVAENDRLVGMLTDRDIALRIVARDKGCQAKVREAMTDQILYCREDDDAEAVADNMSRQGVRRLPVLNGDKRLVGMVSLSDIARREDAEAAGSVLKELALQEQTAA